MKNTIIIVLILLGVALIAVLYLQFNKKQYSWYENYSYKSKQPFGTHHIHELLKSFATDGFTHNARKSLPELLDSASLSGPTVYVAIGDSWAAGDSTAAAVLQKFVADGNDAFLICNYSLYDLLSYTYSAECGYNLGFNFTSLTSIEANFYHPDFAVQKPYSFTHRIKDEDVSYSWGHLNDRLLCDSASSLVPLGYFDPNHVNFFKIPYGKGNFFVHTNPLMFTNYFMVQEENADYAASVFSHSKYRKIIWDDYRITFSFNREANSYSNPLYYIMDQPALRFAWWLLVAIALLYVVFAAKRQQRFIPVVEKKNNTSLEFLKMVSSLHFRNGNHGDIARKKMRFFLHTVRSRYGLNTHTINSQFIEKLSHKSQVSYGEIDLIFQQYRIINNFQDIDSAPLLNLYNAIQNFYNKAK